MLIIVDGILDLDNDVTVVSFESGVGGCKAIWNSITNKPAVNGQYSVEIDLQDILEWDRNTFEETSNQCKIENIGAETILCGTVEAIEDDGLLFLRISPDCLIMIETRQDDVFAEGQWLRITISWDKLSITPT